jgi:hypothetical protein
LFNGIPLLENIWRILAIIHGASKDTTRGHCYPGCIAGLTLAKDAQKFYSSVRQAASDLAPRNGFGQLKPAAEGVG